MARTRQIKPGFFKNEKLAELDPVCRLIFIGLWGLADREGRLEYRPKRIKAEVLPYDDLTCTVLASYLHQLSTAEVLDLYGYENKLDFIQITNFTKHQHCHKDEQPSKLPTVEQVMQCTERAPYLHRTCTALARPNTLLPSTLLPSTLLPNTDVPDLSGGPDVGEVGIRIIEHLNQITGKKYRARSSATQKLIRARLAEGFTEADFQHVHRVKAKDWLGTEREIYLRPETLYRVSHFESYRNQPEEIVTIPDQLRRNLMAGERYMEESRRERDERSTRKQIEADPDAANTDIPEGIDDGYDPPLSECS